MPKKVRDILTEVENVEIARLRLKILQSNSVLKSKRYYTKINQIVLKAQDRYYHQEQAKKSDSIKLQTMI